MGSGAATVTGGGVVATGVSAVTVTGSDVDTGASVVICATGVVAGGTVVVVGARDVMTGAMEVVLASSVASGGILEVDWGNLRDGHAMLSSGSHEDGADEVVSAPNTDSLGSTGLVIADAAVTTGRTLLALLQ